MVPIMRSGIVSCAIAALALLWSLSTPALEPGPLVGRIPDPHASPAWRLRNEQQALELRIQALAQVIAGRLLNGEGQPEVSIPGLPLPQRAEEKIHLLGTRVGGLEALFGIEPFVLLGATHSDPLVDGDVTIVDRLYSAAYHHEIAMASTLPPSVRIGALGALTNLGMYDQMDERLCDEFLDIFKITRDRLQRRQIIMALRARPYVGLRNRALDALVHDPDSDVRRLAATALIPFVNEPAIRAALESAARSDVSKRVREEAREVLDGKPQ